MSSSTMRADSQAPHFSGLSSNDTLGQSAHRHTRFTDFAKRCVWWFNPLGQMHDLLMPT